MSKIIICVLASIAIIVLGYTQIPEWTYSTNAPMFSSLTFADFVGDSVKEVITATYAPAPNHYDYGFVYVFDINGNILPGWPIQCDGAPLPATPAIGDIDGDGIPELVVGNWDSLYIWHGDGTSYPGWPRAYGTAESAVLEDMDADGDMEIIYVSDTTLYVFHEDGTNLPGFPVSVPHSVAYDRLGTPSVADIDGDSLYEIVAGIKKSNVTPGQFKLYAWNSDGSIIAGFPVWLCGLIKATPAIGDLDNDGANEIVINAYYSTNSNDSLYVIDGAGNIKSGWPLCVRKSLLASPALGDIDKDGDLEILLGGDWPSCQLHAFHHDGSAVVNWPVPLLSGGSIKSSPVIADIDGDTSQVEILIKVCDYICGFHADASVVSGFPYYISDQSHSGTYSPAPVIGDMDGDGDVEYALASFFGEIHFFDETQAYYPEYAEWPMYKHDQRNTGFYPRTGVGVEENLRPKQPGNISLLQIYPNPFKSGTQISYTVARKGKVNLCVFDVLGQKIKVLVDEKQGPGHYEVTWNARDERNHGVCAGVYFVRLVVDPVEKTRNYKYVEKVILMQRI